MSALIHEHEHTSRPSSVALMIVAFLRARTSLPLHRHPQPEPHVRPLGVVLNCVLSQQAEHVRGVTGLGAQCQQLARDASVAPIGAVPEASFGWCELAATTSAY